MPSVSVVMPAYNAERWLSDAIGSIVDQTFTDLELIVLDDGSTDRTRAIAESWRLRDDRVRVVDHAGPSGLAVSSNAAVQASSAPLVARMDADDLSHPRRIELQVELFKNDPDAVLCGTLNDGIDTAGRRTRPRDRGRLLQSGPSAPFPHGSVMIRRSAFDEVRGYRASTSGWEDDDLFFRLARVGRVYVLPHALYSYRYHPTNTALTFPDRDRQEALAARDQDLTGDRTRRRVDPAAEMIHTQAAMCVWAGMAPSTRVRLSAHTFGGPWHQTFRSLLYATWGNFHPRSLRAVLAHLVGLRDWYATKRLDLSGPFEWRFG